MSVRETFFSVLVNDMERAIAFYVAALGADVIARTPVWTSIKIAGVRVGLFLHPHEPVRTGLHFAVDDLASTSAAIARAGGSAASPIEVAPGVVTVDATDSEGNTFSLRG